MSAAGSGIRDPQSFDHLPARYDRYASLVGAELHAWLSFHLPARVGRGLDAGCGTGVHTQLLAERCNEVLAVDLSTPMVEHARSHRPRGNVRYEVRDLHDVSTAADGPFDVVLCAYTLHHVPAFVTALEHLRSLCRPGGTVLLVDVVDDRRRVPVAGCGPKPGVGSAPTCCTAAARRARRSSCCGCPWIPTGSTTQATDPLWPPADWDTITGAVYPDAAVTPLYRARALSWAAPAPFGVAGEHQHRYRCCRCCRCRCR